jgi:DNA polymerase-1
MKNISIEAGTIIKNLTEELQEICGYPINPNSPTQLVEYFYEKKGITPYYKDGRPTTDINALVRMSRNGVKEATLVKNIRTWTKRKSTYFDMVLSKDGRLRSAMNPVGAKTGRPSSSEDIFGEGGNILNLPEIVRQFIIADDGMIIYMIDLSQAENRIVANIAPEPLQKMAFDKGIDVHSQTYALINGMAIEDVSDEDGSCELGTGEYSQRFWGKKANHSLNYDLGYKMFSLKYELPERVGKVFVERFHQVYPGIRQYHAWVRVALGKDRTLTNLFGRKRLFLNRWGDDMFREAYAQIPQSTVADKMNEQGIAFIYENQQWFHNVYLMNTIYDSIIFEMPISVGWTEHAEVILRVVESLETPLDWHGTKFTIPADVVMGLSLFKKGGKKVKTNGKTAEQLAGELSAVHEQLGAQPKL